MEKAENNRVLYFDVLNILAIIAVIALHHNGLVHHFQDSRAWRESLVVECAFYWAVPVFLMVSGATLMPYRERYSTAVFMKKRLSRVVIPWLFWSIVVVIWAVYTGQLDPDSFTPLYLADLILNTGGPNALSRYWFIPSIIGIYLAMPVYSAVKDKRELLWYVVILNFIFVSLSGPIKLWTGFRWNISIPVTGTVLIFPLLGYLLHTSAIPLKARISAYLLGIFGLLFRFFYTYVHSIRAQATDTSIKGYQVFHSVFLAVAVFILVRQIPWERLFSPRFRRILSQVAACSFGIYLIHSLVMYYEQKFLGLSYTSRKWRILCVPLTYLLSLGITFCIRKIPKLGKALMG